MPNTASKPLIISGGYENQGYGQRQRPYKHQQQATSAGYYNQPQNYYSNYNRDPYPQQSIQAYPEDGYSTDALYNKYDVVQVKYRF